MACKILTSYMQLHFSKENLIENRSDTFFYTRIL